MDTMQDADMTTDNKDLIERLEAEFKACSIEADEARAKIPRKNASAVFMSWSERAGLIQEAITALRGMGLD